MKQIYKNIILLVVVLYGCMLYATTTANVVKSKVVELPPTATLTVNTTISCVGGTGPIVTFTAVGGTAPYTFVYTLNGVNQTPIETTSNTTTVTVPTENPGNYVYQLTSVTDESGTQMENDIVTVTIIDPILSFTNDANATTCSGDEVLFTPTIINGTAPFTYLWDFGDGTTSDQEMPLHRFASFGCATGTFTVNLTVVDANACSITYSEQITVIQQPDISFIDIDNPFDPFSNCFEASSSSPDYEITVGNTSASTSCITSYSIDWGDGNTANNITFPLSHNYEELGVYSMVITAEASNGCDVSREYIIKNVTNPSGGLTSPGNTQNLCVPTPELQFAISNWAFNSNETTYQISYGDSSPPIILNQSQLLNSPFYNATNPSLSQNYPIPHSYLVSNCPMTEFIASLTVVNACGTTTFTVDNIVILAPAEPEFVAPAIACEDTVILFDNTTSVGFGPNCNQNSMYTWNFGDGTPSVTTSPTSPSDITHLFEAPGTYTVTLTAVNFCGSTAPYSQTICIESALNPQFTVNSNEGCIPFELNINNTTDESASCETPTYFWSVAYTDANCGTDPAFAFSNGTTATSKNPSINFTNPGNYTLLLSATNSCGSFTTSQVITVKQPPTAILEPIANVCGPSTINPTAVITSCAPVAEVLSYDWTFVGGAPATANTANPGAINYSAPGDYTITLTVTNQCGASATATETFTVQPIPVITNTNLDETICSGVPSTAVNLNASEIGTTFSWTAVATSGISGFIPSGTTAVIPAQTIINTNAVSGTITYTITPTLNGCVGTSVTYTITVNPAPEITAQPQSNSICEGGTIADLFVSHINGGGVPSYQWYSNTVNSTTAATEIPGETNASFSPPTAAVGLNYYFVILTFPSGGGCSSITSDIAAIEISEGTTITTQPLLSQDLCVGVSLENPLSINFVGGAGTPSYQWFSNTTNSNSGGTLIAGATNATYTPPVFTTAGTFYYYLVITFSGSGCAPTTSDVATVIVVNDPVITTQPLASQTLCEGILPTDLEVTATGGSGTYSYQWFSNTVNNTTSGVAILGATNSIYTPSTTTAGTLYYYVEITQTGNGCEVVSNTAEVIVNPSPSLTAQPVSSDICLGQTPTVLAVSYANGVGTPTFQWYSNTINDTVGANSIAGATNATFSPPATAIGTVYYYVVLTFSNGGCLAVTSDIATVTINQNPAISNSTDVICSGNSFTIVPDETNGDTIPIGTTYTWSAPIINPAGTITGASAEANPQSSISQTLINTTNNPSTVTYTVTPISGSCVGTDFSVTVTVNPSVNGNVVVNNVSCFGADNASISTNITGGIPFPSGNPYQISWTGPNGFTASTTTINNLEPGVYNLSIVDQGGCPFSESYTITEPDEILISVDNESNIDCFGNNNGAIAISVTGGLGNYSYNWTKDAAPFATTEDLTNLEPGVYVVSISDANNCGPTTATFTITEPPVLTVSLDNQVDVLCFGAATGAIQVNVGGGTPNYTFAWTGPNGFTSSNQNLTNILAGAYILQVTDSLGCSQNLSVTITQPTQILINATTTAIECFGGSNASITVSVSGGNAPYQIEWSNLATGFFQDNLSAGDYTITITDATGCIQTLTVNIPEAPLFDINPIVNQISCFGENDGSINLNFVGGIAPINLVWSDGSTAGTTRNNLGPGTYTVTITDSKPCVIIETFTIIEPQPLVLSGAITNAFECNNANSGAIDLQVSGGTAPFAFSWSNGATSEDLSTISAGNYQVTVTDARGCVQTASYVINRQPPIEITVETETIANCEAQDVKQIFEAQVTGGVPPYQLNWSSGTVSGTNNEFMETNQSGTVILDVTDSLGCTSVYSFNVEVPNIGNTSFTQTSFSFTAFGNFSINDPIQFTNTSTGNYESLVWNFGDGILSSEENPEHIYTGEGSYVISLTVVYPYGCSYEHTVTLLIDKGYRLVMPTGFTPNDDTINDTFSPVFLGMTAIEMSVYDTWGKMIYHEQGESIRGWDGLIKGRVAENGNYFFKVIATPFYGGEVKQDGTFTLIK